LWQKPADRSQEYFAGRTVAGIRLADKWSAGKKVDD
jgi:hypothetical protein